MPTTNTQSDNDFLGSELDDEIIEGFEGVGGDTLDPNSDTSDSVNGREGDDVISTGNGNDLAAGDMVGDEWTYVDGVWVYDPTGIDTTSYDEAFDFDDFIETGDGNDVLLGNGGDDRMYAGLGEDLLNAGRGKDAAYGGLGRDTLNLEGGDDYAEGGQGADVVNGGGGDDVIYGDDAGENLLDDSDAGTTFDALAQGGAWSMVDDNGAEIISQSAATEIGETYTISFELAANLAGGKSAAMVDVIWNGEVVDTVETTSGAYQTFEVDVVSTGTDGALSFRAVEPVDAVTYNFDGPIVSYDKAMEIGGEAVTVSAFAAGQAKLYQVIDGQLNVFDTAAQAYTAVGTAPGFKINAVGFNVEDDLIYGVAKSAGVDSLGNAVDTTDIVMIDALGATYRIGDGYYGDYVGDFDGQGNLWTFHTSLDRISVVDVDNLDANGNPQISFYHFPAGMMDDRTYDLAYDAASGSFLAVVSPDTAGGNGKVVRIDVSNVAAGGEPTFSEVAITGTLYGNDMKDGMAKGSYGAVFFDGDGNLYYGLNKGDHDLDGSTGSSGAIYRVDVDWDSGQAFAQFMSDAPSTGSNDGAVDPRSGDAFVEIDADAAVLLRSPELTLVQSGDDTLRGGQGEDLIFGNEGDDEINGGADNDSLYGDNGHDNISGAAGDDFASGGAGNDSLRGEAGFDVLDGNDGDDFLDGGKKDDALNGGAGTDKLVGGLGADTIEGGAGNDELWGGDWAADGEADVFVFEADSGKDFLHDFETDHDVLDLSAYGTDFATVMNACTDWGWATEINFALLGGNEGDRLTLNEVELAFLDQDNFIL